MARALELRQKETSNEKLVVQVIRLAAASSKELA